MNLEASIRKKLEQNFSPIYLEVENESHKHHRPQGAETHFRIVLVSAAFEGVSRVDRQRQVSALFDEERANGLHAFSQRVMAPAEWDLVKDTFVMKSPTCLGDDHG